MRQRVDVAWLVEHGPGRVRLGSRLVLLFPDGTSATVIMGPDLAAGHRVQHLVPAGPWQAGELVDGGEWALFGCTVTPEFTNDDVHGGDGESHGQPISRNACLPMEPRRPGTTYPMGYPEVMSTTCGPTGTPDLCAVNMGLIHLQAGDLVSAYRYFLPMAENGDPEAIARLIEICERAGDTARADSWRSASTV